MQNISLVILDDHPLVREGLLYMMERESDLEVVADSGQSSDALDLVQKHMPDLLLLDAYMGTPTFNLVKKVQKIKPDIRVLFITAFDSDENILHASRIGAHGLISKLEGSLAICQAIRQVAQGQTYFSDASIRTKPEVKKEKSRSSVSINHPLSPREVDVLCCVAHALTAKEIAKDLHISVKTVDRHKANIMDKLSLRSQIELARYAIRHGFVEL